ncbi:MAG: FecR family protein [Proteobacteria bacterium]|nr:FecR family protein [Pseudomonadota bacterium]
MNISNKFHLVTALLLLASGAAFADTAGHVQFVSGQVSLTSTAGKTHSILKGEAINEGDLLISANNASAQIRMQDGGIIAVRPDTQLKIDSFKYSGREDGSERSFFSLVKGGFRAITGAIGQVNKSNYRITTPTSTIGIRGTDHETIVVAPGSELAVVAPVGTYNRVNVGETSLTTNKGTIDVLPNQMGFAGAADEAPKLQPVNLNLFSVTMPARPEHKQNKPDNDQGKNGKESGESKGKSNGDTVREKAVVDESPSATTGSAPPPAGDGGVTTVAPPVVVQASGQTINLDNQTITTTAGTTTPISSVTTAAYVQNDLAVVLATSSASYLQSFSEVATLIAAPADVNNTLPNPVIIDRYSGKNAASSVTYSLNGTTVVGQATTTLANGIQFGRYDSTSSQKVVTGNTSCCTTGNYPSPGPVFLHWIVGPAVNPVYLPEVLLGTTNYSFAGGTTPTSSFIGTSTVLNSAALSVNFTQQTVAFSLGLTVGGAAWGASSTAAPLTGLYWNSASVGFHATTMVNTNWAPLTVTGGATSGDVVGQLTGNALNGAMLSYVLSGTSNQVAGVAAFTGTPLNSATPYRIAALSYTATIPAAQVNAGLVVPTTTGGYNNSASVLFDATGNMTQFNANSPFSNGSGINAVNLGSATAVGLGTDPVSGISWGRWQGGALSITNITNTTVTNPANASSAHWITGPIMTAPVDLPISGTYNYVLSGGTTPTDSLGGVGTLNSASLTANFTAQTVNIGLNVTTPNAGNLVANALNVPIEQKNFFNAASANSPNGGANLGLLTVTCAAGCGAATISGNVGGVFVGAGGIGAGMAYGFSNGTVNVNGVAAFHR